MPGWFQKRANQPNEFSVSVRAKPNASRSRIIGISSDGNHLEVGVSAPPVDGAANAELIVVFSKTLKIRKSDVEILRGESSRGKVVLIKSVSEEQILSLVEK